MTNRPRARDWGLPVGTLQPGPSNSITDVAGVRVGHLSLIEGDRTRTGVTVISPHEGNPFQSRVPAGFAAGNGYGKFAGTTQIEELGEIETPIALTNTLSVPEAAAGLIEWTLQQVGNERVRSINAVVGEVNDAKVNAIRERAVRPGHVLQAIAHSSTTVEEGSVGAGVGGQLFGWKGGIGTSSRRLTEKSATYMLGALVQTNYGGVLSVLGAPVGVELADPRKSPRDEGSADGSVIVILATDAPLSAGSLTRLARRAFLGLGRTGSTMSNGSGEYALAFTINAAVRRKAGATGVAARQELENSSLSSLFQAAVEATEEAVLNALLKATTIESALGRLDEVPLDKLAAVLGRYGLGPSARR
jgi:D-aminopeptidase